MPTSLESTTTDPLENIVKSEEAKPVLVDLPDIKESSTTIKPEVVTDNAVVEDNPKNDLETPRNVDVLNAEAVLKIEEDLKLQSKKEEDHKFKDSPKDVTAEEIHKQSESWKDFEDDFSLLEDRMPDLTDEEYGQINKDGAMPWNFLKSLDVKRDVDEIKPRPLQALTPIYITVPIVINTHSTLPITLTIGGQKVPLKLPTETKPIALAGENLKTPTSNTIVTPTSIFNKLMDYSEPPLRQTNRHRSNFRKKIYARNNNHQVEEFEYKNEEI
ncbi:hypothetical protein FF38_11616 [Lucilia cuprina]|uniref:Uncharacterized protein n=1 Tax=Lucilia cuprina TaxID=7375 RepID=A0A0L0BVJ1_LUCCU|nr:uncharacterized protein LOC111683840 [Lucilia cuprina]KNC24003.1 hypothetical protein FF38_11616 [Lucilia cuprina]